MTFQGAKDVIDLIAGLATILALLVGGGAALFLFFQFAPVLSLKILPEWNDESKQNLTIRFEVENKSRVRVYNPIIRIQVLEQQVSEGGYLSQWVPFSKDAIRSNEQPVVWNEPEKISTTKRIYPGEVISAERFYHCPQAALILHVGLEVRIKLGLFGRIVTRKSGDWNQTTTRFVVK